MTTNNYVNSTVTNNYSEVKRGYIHIDELFPAMCQAQAILSLMGCSNNDMDEEIENAIWAVHDLVANALTALRNRT